jgi:hypothetical protein
MEKVQVVTGQILVSQPKGTGEVMISFMNFTDEDDLVAALCSATEYVRMGLSNRYILEKAGSVYTVQRVAP